MKNVKPIITFISAVVFSVMVYQCSITTLEVKQNSNYKTIRSGFETPTDDNTLWCYWYWIGDDISKDGITKDLEAMKAAGIGGALIGNINPEEKDGKVPILSEEWWDHMVHAVNEGKRIGVDIGAFNSPGWSQSGGPWVKPEMAMRYMTYSEVNIQGGKNINLQLAKPHDEFQEVYVLAFPTLASENKTLSTKNTTLKVTPSIDNQKNLIDNDTTSIASFSKAVKDYQIDLKSDKTLTARSLKIIPDKKIIELECEVLAEVDGNFKSIKTFKINRTKLDPTVGPDKFAPILVSLPDTESTNFRIKFKTPARIAKAMTAPDANIQFFDISEIQISEAAGLEDYAEKNLTKMHPTPLPAWDSYLWKSQPAVDDTELKITSSNIIDISDKMYATGKLNWDAPEGNWTVQRYGMTPTGTKNAPAAPQGKGYEIDKANKELIQFHYEQYIWRIAKKNS